MSDAMRIPAGTVSVPMVPVLCAAVMSSTMTIPDFHSMTNTELSAWYVATVGYDPLEDGLTRDELIALCTSYAEEAQCGS